MNIVYAYTCDQIFFHERLNAIEFLSALSILIIAIGVATYKIRLQRLDKLAKERSAAEPLLSSYREKSNEGGIDET